MIPQLFVYAIFGIALILAIALAVILINFFVLLGWLCGDLGCHTRRCRCIRRHIRCGIGAGYIACSHGSLLPLKCDAPEAD